MRMKECKVCHVRKQHNEFPLSGGNRRRNMCKVCYAALQKIKMRYRKQYAKKEV